MAMGHRKYAWFNTVWLGREKDFTKKFFKKKIR
jgi:hypothetical protein